MMQKQTIKTQKGEIEFRKKLVNQQVYGKKNLENEYDALEIEKILIDRMAKTFHQIKALLQSGVVISPYIEIGAERCQRSLVMENDMDARGAAVDISFDMLVSGEHYRQKMNKKVNPLRVCCDAYNLPFMSGSVPFVFCYETLHHFPELGPIVNEVHRVLAPGGYFFFDEEPFKKLLHINLYANKSAYSKKTLKRGKIKKILDYFLAQTVCNETDHDIIENESLSIEEWEQALNGFDEKQVVFQTPARFINYVLSKKKRHPIRLLFTRLLGGTVKGQCRKSMTGKYRSRPINEVLICPSCRVNGRESPLMPGSTSLLCKKCMRTFPIYNNVLLLFTENKLSELYPELCQPAGSSAKPSTILQE